MDGYLGELQGGVTYINTVKGMLEEAENDWPKMLARLQRVRATLLSKEKFLVNLTGDKVWARGQGLEGGGGMFVLGLEKDTVLGAEEPGGRGGVGCVCCRVAVIAFEKLCQRGFPHVVKTSRFGQDHSLSPRAIVSRSALGGAGWPET